MKKFLIYIDILGFEELAEEIEVDPGETIAFAKNIHIYDRAFELAEKLIKTKTERQRVDVK